MRRMRRTQAELSEIPFLPRYQYIHGESNTVNR